MSLWGALASVTLLSAQTPAGVKSNQLIVNERVTVMRLTAAGLTEDMHITPQDVVAIQTGPGQIEMQIGNEVTKGAPGKVWYLPKTIEHALFNRGSQPVDKLVVMFSNNEPARSGSATARRSAAEAGPSNRLIDNERVSVMRVPAPVGMKQDMHKSPEDPRRHPEHVRADRGGARLGADARRAMEGLVPPEDARSCRLQYRHDSR